MVDLEPPAKRIRVDHTDGLDEQPVEEPVIHQKLTEEDCGIRFRINKDQARFSCVLKALTSDFQVFEVDQGGKIIKLTDVPSQNAVEQDRRQAKLEQKEKETKIQQLSFDYETSSAQELISILGQEDFDKLGNLVSTSQGWVGEGSNAPLPVITKVIEDKAIRTQVHQGIREVFLGSIESEARDDKRMKLSIKLRKSNDRRQRHSQPQSRPNPRSQDGDYTHFTVYKDGRDTMDVVSNLARALKVPAKSFTFAGTKDRRGCTTQRFSAHRMAIPRLAGLNTHLKGIKLGDFTFAKKQFKLGDLSGNRFVLALRDLQGANDKQIESALRVVKETGYINYFGLQRFGTSSTGTHEVGIHALRGEFEKACDLILSEHSGAWVETKEAKMHWIETRNAQSTLDKMPNKCIAEQAILKHLIKNGQKGDWTGAFGSIPRNLRLMYIHAYQSLVWNNVVSSRLEADGLKPIAGDLVIDGETEGDNVTRAKLITAEEVDQYTIHDIVLPLPGCDITYPEHSSKQVYVEFMKQHDLDPFDMVRKTKEMSLLGSYRKLFSRPVDLDWQFMTYSDAEEQLLATTLDELEGREIQPAPGEKRALRLSFQLGTSSYATMLLREIITTVPHSI